MVPFQQLRFSAMVERLLKLAVCILNCSFFAQFCLNLLSLFHCHPACQSRLVIGRQRIYLLKRLRDQGLDLLSLDLVFQAVVLAEYFMPSQLGVCSCLKNLDGFDAF